MPSVSKRALFGIAGVLGGIEIVGASGEEMEEEVVERRGTGTYETVTRTVAERRKVPEQSRRAQCGGQVKGKARAAPVTVTGPW